MSKYRVTIMENGERVMKRLFKRNLGKAHAPHTGKHPWVPPAQRLTDERFMSASQKRAHREGQEIWV